MQRSDGRHAAPDPSKRRRARHWLFITSVFVALFSVVLMASPAGAMTTSEAIKACDANPACEMNWGAQNDAITMHVKGSDKVIDCPKKEGPCVAVITPTGQGVDARGDRPGLASDGHGAQKFRASFTAVLTACTDAKGVFADDVARYSCTKANCDGRGGSCTVKCSRDGHCQANTPKIMVGNVTILMILQNGSNVHHSVVPLEPNHSSPNPPQEAGTPGATVGASPPSPGGGTVGGPPSLL